MQAEEMFILGQDERKTGEFRYSMTITNSRDNLVLSTELTM